MSNHADIGAVLEIGVLLAQHHFKTERFVAGPVPLRRRVPVDDLAQQLAAPAAIIERPILDPGQHVGHPLRIELDVLEINEQRTF